jgi:hypothetical protein
LNIIGVDLTLDDIDNVTGLASDHGEITLMLSAVDALLDVLSGSIITRADNKDITITADDIDVHSGAGTIIGTGELHLRANSSDWNYYLGTAAETEVGLDVERSSYEESMYLGTRDLAGLADGFSRIRIDRLDSDSVPVANQMIWGDALFQDNLVAYATSMEVRGHLQLNNDEGNADSGSIELYADKNLTLLKDSRISAPDLILLTADNIIVNSGARIYTTSDDSVVDLNARVNISLDGAVEARGIGSTVDADAIETLTLDAGGIAAAYDRDGHVDLYGGNQLIVESGGSVQAGVKFRMDQNGNFVIDENDEPILDLLATGADATLTAGNELIIFGNINTSDELNLISGAAGNVTSPNNVSAYFSSYGSDDYLYGTTAFSLFMAGTLRTLGTDALLDLSGEHAIIIIGIVQAIGAGTDAIIRSEDWVYLDTHLKVADNLQVWGGYDSSFVSTGGANTDGSSVYIDQLAILNTLNASSSIQVHGAQDVDLWGPVISGAAVVSEGSSFNGGDSTVTVTAGEQVLLASGLQASGDISVTGGTPDSDDNNLSVILDTRAGIYSAGITSDNSGSSVAILSPGNVEIMGHVVSGAVVSLEYDENGLFQNRSFNWSDEPSEVLIDVDGQAFIGGNTFNTSGNPIQVGGYIYANNRIQIDGGIHDATSMSVLVHAASEIVTNDPDSSIEIDADVDAVVYGVVMAGGTVTQQRDGSGTYQGRSFERNYADREGDNAFDDDGTSTITINATEQIFIGTDLSAWSSIALNGGTDTPDGGQYEGRGIVLLGSANLTTWAENSTIDLNAPGQVDILAPGYSYEIWADGWAPNAEGQLTSDVTLIVQVDKVDFVIEGIVTIAADATNDGIAALRDDVQTALETATWKVISNDGSAGAPVVGTTFTEFSADPDIGDAVVIDMSLRDGKLLFTSAYEMAIVQTSDDTLTASANATELGLSQLSSGDIQSESLYTISASAAGSVVNIGAAAGPNEKLYIAGSVLAHQAINLYSGASSDGIDIDLDYTGLLETVDGSIAFSAGDFGDIKGSVIAGGESSDVILTAVNAMVLRGDIRAGRHIETSTTGAGLVHTDFSTRMEQSAGEASPNQFFINNLLNGALAADQTVSIYLDNTSSLAVTGTDPNVDRHIYVTGSGDVVVNGFIGGEAGDLHEIKAASTNGDLHIVQQSGRIESSAYIVLEGVNVNVYGLVENTLANAVADDFEITIDASDTAKITGDLSGQGSILILQHRCNRVWQGGDLKDCFSEWHY